MSYETPVGTFDTWEQAAVAVERADMDPCLCIRMVAKAPPVALAWAI